VGVAWNVAGGRVVVTVNEAVELHAERASRIVARRLNRQKVFV
jgi:hypothetical protein